MSLKQPGVGLVRTEIMIADKQSRNLAGLITGPMLRVKCSDAFGINAETHEGIVVLVIPLEVAGEVAPSPAFAVSGHFRGQFCSESK